MKSGNLRKLYIFYWRHSIMDWENARTKELRDELTYDSTFPLNLRFRDDLDYKFMNVNRSTDDYVRHRDIVELYRSKKIRREPLVYLELWRPNNEGTKEEYHSIDSDYRLKLVLRRIHEVLSQE
jgi:hypothetical protein